MSPLSTQAFLQRLGVPGILALGVLVASAAMYLSAHRPLLLDLRAAREAVRVLAAQPQESAARAGEAGLRAFYAHFATGVAAHEWLEVLFALAREHGVELQQGNYRYELPEGARLARYEMTLPLSGDYARIRTFLAAVLNRIPVASLDHVAFERASGAEVAATVRMTLFLDPRVQLRP